ncbi:MAG: transposase [Pseudomonadales bacterium]
MARPPRICPPGLPAHIIQRGVNRQPCFASEKDYAAYAHFLAESAQKYNVAVHAWVFMTNHVHLLVTPDHAHGVSKMMQAVGRHYVRSFNAMYGRSGTLWEGRFRSCIVETEDYLLRCYRYIELNPVRANIVEAPGEYKWSSFRSNALGTPSSLLTPHPLYSSLGTTPSERLHSYKKLFDGYIDKNELEEIRRATNKGMAFGSEQFKDDVEKLTGRRVRTHRRGRLKQQTG